MTNLVEKTKSSRQTFTIPQYIVKRLEIFAKEQDKKKSNIVAKALEDFLKKEQKSNRVKKRLDALEGLIGIAPEGSLRDLDTKDVLAKKALKYVQ